MYTDDLKKLINTLNNSNIDYVLLENKFAEKINNYDFLIKNDDYVKIFEECGLCKSNFKNKESFWYGASKPRVWLLSNGDKVSVYRQIVVRSLTAGIWIPIDKVIQKSAFDNKLKTDFANDVYAFELCDLDKMIYIISKAVFTTKVFSGNDISFISEKIKEVDIEQLVYRLDKVFFKFTEKLMGHIKNGSFNQILYDYLRFKEY